MSDIEAKVARYEMMLRTALDRAEIVEDQKFSKDVMMMARSYYADGVHFQKTGDFVNALVCFSYGHGWLDAGVRAGTIKSR